MESVDLCSDSDSGGGVGTIYQHRERDLVGSLTDNSSSDEDSPTPEKGYQKDVHPTERLMSDSSNDTILWQPSPQNNKSTSPQRSPGNNAGVHNMSPSPRYETYNSSPQSYGGMDNANPWWDDVETQDTDFRTRETTPDVISLHSEEDCVGRPGYVRSGVERSDESFLCDDVMLCNDDDSGEKETPVLALTRTTKQTQSSSGVSSISSQEERGENRKLTMRSKEDKENVERAKTQRKKVLAMLKALKPGECMKYLTMECCSELVNNECFSRVSEVIGVTGVLITPQGRPCCVTWTRRLPPHLQDNHGELHLCTESREPHMLIVLQQPHAVDLLIGRTFLSYVSSMRSQVSTDTSVTLILHGMEPYFRRYKNQSKNKWKEGVRGQGGGIRVGAHITEADLEYHLTKLLIDEGVSCCRTETPEEFAQTLLSVTKAVAEAPFKKEKYEQDMKAQFYMRGDNRDCVKVDLQGNGLLRLWSQSLCKFPHAGLEVGQAVCGAYSSPIALYEALRSLEDVSEAVNLLGQVAVRRDRDPTAGTKRLGPELAKKLATYFTATSGDTPLS